METVDRVTIVEVHAWMGKERKLMNKSVNFSNLLRSYKYELGAIVSLVSQIL